MSIICVSFSVDNDIDLRCLQTMTEDDFKDVHIESFGERRKLTLAIKSLLPDAPSNKPSTSQPPCPPTTQPLDQPSTSQPPCPPISQPHDQPSTSQPPCPPTSQPHDQPSEQLFRKPIKSRLHGSSALTKPSVSFFFCKRFLSFLSRVKLRV